MYEYKILNTEHPTCSVEQLNNFGNDGWKLITIYEWSGKWYYYFIREIATQ